MRTKEKLANFKDVMILCQYLYLSNHHFISIDNGMAILEIRMNDNFGFSVKNLNFPELAATGYTESMNVPNMLGIIEHLKKVPAVEYKDNFSNRWEEIRTVVIINGLLNEN